MKDPAWERWYAMHAHSDPTYKDVFKAGKEAAQERIAALARENAELRQDSATCQASCARYEVHIGQQRQDITRREAQNKRLWTALTDLLDAVTTNAGSLRTADAVIKARAALEG